MTIRRFLLIVFLLGILGTAIELILIGHREDAWQWTPFLLFLLGIACLIPVAFRSSGVRIFQGVMVLFVISGFLGIGLHYKAKSAFKQEVNPNLEGIELLKESIQGATVPPLLAPGMMIHLGLVGFLYSRLPR